MTPHSRAFLQIHFCVVLWGFTAILGKLITLPAATLVWWRMVLVTGALLLQRLAPSDHGLLTSSRVSGEIADKAARAGFAWLASHSIPTSLAVRFASAAHMPIIGRAAGKGAFIYR